MAEKQLGWRLALALMLIMISKAAGLVCPFFLKHAVDALSSGLPTATSLAAQAILMYGAIGALQHLAKECQYPIFSPLSQAVSRRVAYHTFAHVLDLDVKFHLDRRTGRLSRILERGTRSIQTLYRAVIFTFLPTAVELFCVIGLLATHFSVAIAAAVAATFVAYVVWTVFITQRAAEVRKEVNNLDNLTTSKAVDALLNFETVALFNNQRLEVKQYDTYLTGYQRAMVQTERLAAALNAGQHLVLSCGLCCALMMAVTSPAAAPGDIIVLQGLLLQLWAPLQFLGWFYRELRQSLVDMEEFFTILRTRSNLKDGTRELPDLPPPSAVHRPEGVEPATAAWPQAVKQDSELHSGADSTLTQLEVEAAVRSGGITSSSGNGVGHDTVSTGSRYRTGAINSGSSISGTSDSSVDGHSAAVGSVNGMNGRSGANGVAGAKGQEPGLTVLDLGLLMEVPPAPGLSLGRMEGLQAEADLWRWRWQAGGQAEVASSTAGRGLQIEMRGVGFGYHPERQVLSGLDLTIAPGHSVAVVGPSGSGKSTILKLLARLYDTVEGQVLINGVDVRELKLQSLRNAIAVVPQDTVLFNDSVLQNVRYGRPSASDEEVVAAVHAARLHEAIMTMPEAYETVVGERGLKLSGGEKQRVAIARAFLRSPRLLVCDEATSALDTATEAGIMASLTELAAGRTSVFVAHRLSTVRGCDKIVVLNRGRVVEQGTHEQLMAFGGMYREMWDLQAAEANRPDMWDGGGSSSDSDEFGEQSLTAVAARAVL